MSFIIIPSLREKLGLNISSSELKKLDVKSVRNVDILRLKQTLIRSLNIQKREVIATFLAKLATPQKLLLPRPRLKPQLQHEVLPLHLALSSHVDSINIRHPETISQLKEEAKAGKYEKFEGTNREVFIDKKTGRGYKIFKQDSTWGALTNADLRVNDVYCNHNFYDGKYAIFANNDLITMRDDRVCGSPRVRVFTFQKIPGAKHLDNHEKIPYSVLVMMEQAGFRPFDVKPDNFMKVKNSHGRYDYLPIDAKQIGLTRSNSERSREVREFKQQHGPYYYGQRYVDYNK